MPPPTADASEALRPDPFPEFVTHNPEEAHAFMCSAYVDHSMRITGSVENFTMRHSYQDTGAISIGTLTHTMGVELGAQPLERLLFCRVLNGQIERETDGLAERFRAQEIFPVAAPDKPYICRWDKLNMQVIGVSDDTMRSVIGEVLISSPQPSRRPTDMTAARFCLDLLDFLTQELMPNEQAMASPLIVGSAARMLAVALLTTFPWTTWTADDTVLDRADATPATLRRALAYLDSHADQDVAPADIAAAANVTYRAVQLAFRRHLGTTPMRYLRHIRLQHARDELIRGGRRDSATVAAVALKWGFPSVNRFIEHYRRTYYTLPGEHSSN